MGFYGKLDTIAHLAYHHDKGVAMADNDGWLTIPEVASRLAVSERTVRHWLQRGILAGYKFGGWRGEWRIDKADLERFIADSRNRPT